MRPEDVLAALALPDECAVGVRVPKTQLVEHGGFAAADRRRIQEGIDTLRWAAAVRPTQVGIPAHSSADGTRLVPELQAMTLRLRPGAPAARLGELVHRAIPYPLVLITEQEDGLTVSLALKRVARGRTDKAVLDGEVLSVPVPAPGGPHGEFLRSLALERQPQRDLLAVYQGWMDCTVALRVAATTGEFRPAGSPEETDRRRRALLETGRLETELARLTAAARKERQMARQVRLNARIKAVRAELRARREEL